MYFTLINNFFLGHFIFRLQFSMCLKNFSTFIVIIEIILFYIFAIVLATGSFFIIGTHPNTGVIVADVNFPEVRATTNSIMLLANTVATAIFIPIFTILAIYTPLNYSGTYFLFMLICFPSAFLFLLSMRKSIIPNIERLQEELRRRVEKEKVT